MKTNYLLPNRCKKIGWILFIPGIILGLLFLISQPEPSFLDLNVFQIAGEEFFGDDVFFSLKGNNILNEIISLLIIVGAIFIAFSKEKSEDEFISKIRLESLVWAIYINYVILILSIIFVYGLSFLWVLMFNMFTILFFFIIRFNWALFKSKNQIRDKEIV